MSIDISEVKYYLIDDLSNMVVTYIPTRIELTHKQFLDVVESLKKKEIWVYGLYTYSYTIPDNITMGIITNEEREMYEISSGSNNFLYKHENEYGDEIVSFHNYEDEFGFSFVGNKDSKYFITL